MLWQCCATLPAAATGGRSRRSTAVSHAPLAQLAEQLTLNQRVRGSSPWRRTLHHRSDQQLCGALVEAGPRSRLVVCPRCVHGGHDGFPERTHRPLRRDLGPMSGAILLTYPYFGRHARAAVSVRLPGAGNAVDQMVLTYVATQNWMVRRCAGHGHPPIRQGERGSGWCGQSSISELLALCQSSSTWRSASSAVDAGVDRDTTALHMAGRHPIRSALWRGLHAGGQSAGGSGRWRVDELPDLAQLGGASQRFYSPQSRVPAGALLSPPAPAHWP